MTDLRLAIDDFDLRGYLIEHGGREYQRGEWTLTCPICSGEKLMVNSRKRTWHCWVCQRYELRWIGDRYKRVPVVGAGGLLQLVQALEGCSRNQAEIRVLRGCVRRPGSLQRVDVDELVGPPPLPREAPAIAPPPGVIAFEAVPPYLRSRGLTSEDLKIFSLAWCAWGRYANRCIFPCFEGGRLVYWQARAMWEGQGPDFVKALNPPRLLGGVTSAETLFNLDQAVREGCGHVCICEGPIDAIHAGYDAVCSFGKQLSGAQIGKLLQRGVDRLDLMWDADASADSAAVAKRLSMLFRVRLVSLPFGDPGDWSRDQLCRMRHSAPWIWRESRLARL
jgi:hypothetical protein